MWTAVLAGLKAAAAFFGFGEKVVEEIHNHNVEIGGENKIIAADNAATAKAEYDAAQAMVDTTRDSAIEQLRSGRA